MAKGTSRFLRHKELDCKGLWFGAEVSALEDHAVTPSCVFRNLTFLCRNPFSGWPA